MKRMLIDAAHPEETRVVILDAGKIDDFEIETQGKQQLKGNIYIGHVSRVEPSLQAAFITYGGNRNGFLAFGEVHPQFFAVKPAEKEELLREVAEAAARRRGADMEGDDEPEAAEAFAEKLADAPAAGSLPDPVTDVPPTMVISEPTADELTDAEAAAKASAMADAGDTGESKVEAKEPTSGRRNRQPRRVTARARPQRAEAKAALPLPAEDAEASESPSPKEAKEGKERTRSQPPIHRRYRIQDVLKEGQKILVQVVKEERGSKGAALTTYFSLPGRYTVLMPNTPYAGGISRKITDPAERRQLKDVYGELKVPDTMGLIIRTAGVGQPNAQIKHDYDNLTNLWQHINEEFVAHEDIRCIHEDGSVIIRALRDMTSDDIEEIVISGPRAYKLAKDFAKNLMPDTLRLIKQHKDETPLFTQAKVEAKLNHLHHTRVTLPSGGYLVINPTEALVSVDINSGRATQERNIEETALKTNMEACEELARQIRLRDLAGLIVVDFIDMEDHRNVRKVEGAMRKALKRDRARIQTGNISDFGLMEISRQRLRPSFGESHFIACPHCLGTGMVHSPASSALMVLRKLEEDDIRDADRVIVSSSTSMVLWLLNHKRDLIRSLEERYKYQLQFKADDHYIAPDHALELVRIKADGTESSQIIEMIVREQPELPPELRQKQQRHPRPETDRPEKTTDKPERSDDKTRSNRRPEKATDAKPEAKPEKSEQRRPEKPGKPEKSEGRRPRRNEAATAEAGATETTATTPESKGRNNRRPEKATDAKPAAPKPQGQPQPKPARVVAPAEDQPLAVQKVAMDNDDSTPVIASAPRKKFEIRKQADTDAADTPIAIAKVSAEDTTAKPKKAKEPAKEKPKSLISRLIGS